jgi:transposase
VSREHRRAKTDRLDTELLMRAFLGWLRGERRYCSMAAIPTIEEEDARRPNRKRKNLVTEQTRIVNQVKAIFARFGIRTLRPTERKVEERLEAVRTAEGTPTESARWPWQGRLIGSPTPPFLKVSIVDQRINMQPCPLRLHHRIAFESSRNMTSTGATAPSSITPTRSCDVWEGEMTF